MNEEMSEVLIDQNMNITGNWIHQNVTTDIGCASQHDRVVRRPFKQAVRGDGRRRKVKPPNGICMPQDTELQGDSKQFTQLKPHSKRSGEKETISTGQDETEEEDDEEDASGTQDPDDLPAEDSPETLFFRVGLVKHYAWIKEEMSKSAARSVANHLYQSEPRLLSRYEHESILQCCWRRDAVENLLKKVLMGRPEIHTAFLAALEVQEEKHIAEKLTTEPPSDNAVEVFKALEKSSLRQCARPDSHEPRLQFTASDQDTLLYYLNNKSVIDNLNDHLLSRFLFSIREHTNIVHCTLDGEKRVKQTIDTLKHCAEKIFCDFCEILEHIEMGHVIAKLEKRSHKGSQKQRSKRKPQPSQELDSEASTSSGRTTPKRMCMNSLVEHRLVSSMQKSSSNVRLHAMDQFGFDIENINKGSIVLQLCPKEPDSWRRLEENCRTGKIKEFIPVVYNNEVVKDLLQEGEYRLNFTIYTLPTKPGTEGDKKAMFHLDTDEKDLKEENSKAKDSKSESHHHENHIEDQMDLLCEELEITKELLSLLIKEKLVDQNIKEEINKQGTRKKKIEYLLKRVAAHGEKGYTMLKEYIREENEMLYKAMVAKEEVKAIDFKMDTAANVSKNKPGSGGHRGVFKKEVFFTGTVILKVKKTVAGKKGKGESKTTLDISCPEIIDPVCYFADKGKENKGATGEVTMVLGEAWSVAGKEQSPQQDIVVGKRKQSKSTEGKIKRHHSAEDEEDENISDVDLNKDEDAADDISVVEKEGEKDSNKGTKGNKGSQSKDDGKKTTNKKS